MTRPFSVNADRLQRHLHELAQIGKRDDDGVCRLAFSQEDLDGRNWVAEKLRGLGIEVRIDAIGNLFGILRGLTPERAVMSGSHIDTVATGGRYDGALGVVAALECIERLVEEGITPRRSIILASFVNEEGVRFMPDMMGSLVHSGQLSLDLAKGATDQNGVAIGDELDRLNYSGADSLTEFDIEAFIELHIEQGPVLEDSSTQIGVVSHVQGLCWLEVDVRGASNHAGTTPMERRRDAGAVAGLLMGQLRDLPSQINGLRLTIGAVTFQPNLINVIPNQVRFTVDFRHPDQALLRLAKAKVDAILASPQSCSVESRQLAHVQPCAFSPLVTEVVQDAARLHGYSSQTISSGAGHDAQILQSCYPSGMIFIPSRDGISHDVSEYSTPGDIEAGANVLLGTLLSLSGARD